MRGHAQCVSRLALRGREKSGKHLSVLRAWPFWVILGLLVIVYGAVLWHVAFEERLLRNGDTPPTELATGTDLHIPANRLTARGGPSLFQYGHREDTRFVVRREADNQVEVALAACAYCYRRTPQPSYVLKGEVMCGMCTHPMRMPVASQHASNRRCELVPVPYHREQDEIVIPFDVIMSALQKLPALHRF